jgi:hypothetical protein
MDGAQKTNEAMGAGCQQPSASQQAAHANTILSWDALEAS